ncbi:ATP-binding protein [Streptomyces sp. NPDC056661]|uniref:ATP-binding protein n=1 Tax=Streptomyces sp. NPDC056661 TaxID=3345898 RepID=UPI003674B9F9
MTTKAQADLTEDERDAILDAWLDARVDEASNNKAGRVDTESYQDFALGNDETAAAAARAETRRVLTEWGIGQARADEVLLVVSELVTNAIEHALPPVNLRLQHQATGGAVHVEVSDGGPSAIPGPWIQSCEPEEHGRGSLIVACLATAHGMRGCRGGGTTQWADLPSAA